MVDISKISFNGTEYNVKDENATTLANQAIQAVEDEVANRQSEIAVERARIDNIVSLPEGSTAGDAELSDIRVGADGVTYDSAGTAVRTQLNAKFDKGEVVQTLGDSETQVMSQRAVRKTFLTAEILNNIFLNDSRIRGYVKIDGTFETENPDWNRTDYIPIYKEFILSLEIASPLPETVGYNIAYYDIEKKFVGGVEFENSDTVNKIYDVPAGVAYVIISSVIAENSEKDCIETLVNNGLNEMKERICLLESSVIRPFNLAWEDGYIKEDGNVETANTDWSNTGYISLRDVKALFISGNFDRVAASIGITFAFYDNNKTLVSGITDTAVSYVYDNYKMPVPENASYLIISNTITNRDSVVLSGAKIVSSKVATYVVDKNENGDFTTVTEAVANAKTGDIIFVKSGNYENEHIEGFGKSISIIGESPLNTVLSCDDNTYDAPTLEFSTGVLKNLTIKRNNIEGSGYAFHCEDNYQFNKTLFVENCIFSSPTHNCVGMGMRGGCKIVFKDCQFFNTENQGPVFYLHDAEEEAYVGDHDIAFVNCYFSNLGNWIMELQSQEREGSSINIGFNGNRFYGAGSSATPYILFKNYRGGVSTNPDDWNGLINWRLKAQSNGNNFTALNKLPTYDGINY